MLNKKLITKILDKKTNGEILLNFHCNTQTIKINEMTVIDRANKISEIRFLNT